MIEDVQTIFTPIYSIGHLIGEIVAKLVQGTSGVFLPVVIIDNIGLLTVMTVLLILVDITKKITWGILTICWALIIMRIGMLMVGN